MEDKKEYCENLIRRWKELREKLPKAQDPRKPIEPSYITPNEMEELNKTTEELKKDCLEYLSPEDKWEIENN